MKVAVSFIKTFLAPLATVALAAATDGAFQEKSVEEKSREDQGRNHFSLSHKRLIDIIRNIKSLENSGTLIDRVSETIKP